MKRSRRWAPFLVGVIAFLTTSVLLSAWVADWALRNQEMDAFISAVEQSESQMTWTQANVGLILDEVEEPGGGGDIQAAAEDLKGIAAQGRDRIRQAGELVAQVRISPWHQDLLAARAAYLEHNQAWQAYLDRASKDAAEFTVPQDLVNSTFMEAEPAFRKAIPEPDGYDLGQRIDLIFAEPEPAEGPTQQASLDR